MDKYLTVTALTRYIKRKIDTDPHLKNIWLKGEISNFKHHNRGHMYLTIKDDQTRIQAVMFKGNNRFLKFTPEDGMHVLIRGEVGVFEPYGQYQLYIQQMEPDGIGSLYLAFEQLKEKLRKQGYFAPEHKRSLPPYPKHIGVITSPTGAAIRDIITTIQRRYPIAQTTVIPVLVQGPQAADTIVRAIELANVSERFDVLIIGRGGGSIEELWSFNEEAVARAIFHSKVPIISAIGHETDTTISDFVSDLRAPTPTGAAELAVPSMQELIERIETLKRSLQRIMKESLLRHRQSLQHLQQSYAFRYPAQLLLQKEQELDHHDERLKKEFQNLLDDQRERVSQIEARLHIQHPKRELNDAVEKLKQIVKRNHRLMSQIIEKKSFELSASIDQLSLLNPLHIMKRGFAIPYTSDGTVVSSVRQVDEKDQLTIHVADGRLDCEVCSIEEETK